MQRIEHWHVLVVRRLRRRFLRDRGLPLGE
jgi:hypothetical protein